MSGRNLYFFIRRVNLSLFIDVASLEVIAPIAPLTAPPIAAPAIAPKGPAVKNPAVAPVTNPPAPPAKVFAQCLPISLWANTKSVKVKSIDESSTSHILDAILFLIAALALKIVIKAPLAAPA